MYYQERRFLVRFLEESEEPLDSTSSMIATTPKFLVPSTRGPQNRGKQVRGSRLRGSIIFRRPADDVEQASFRFWKQEAQEETLSRGTVSGDTMNKQRSRARSSELVERGLIGILIAVPGRTRTAPEVFARGLKRLQHQSRLASLALRRANPLALLSALKHYEAPREPPLPLAAPCSKAASTRARM